MEYLKIKMEAPLKDNLFLKLFFGFIVLIIAITLLHESGHYLAAKAYGNQPDFHSNSVSYNSFYKVKPSIDSLKKFHSILSDEVYMRLSKRLMQHRKESFVITLAGPVTNMLIGTIGFVLLFVCSRKKNFEMLRWILMFITLFWVRQLLMLPPILYDYFTENESGYYKCDEEELSNLRFLPMYTFGLIFFIAGVIMIAIPMFKFFNFNER